MAICVLVDIANGNREMYEATISRIDLEGNWPEGLIGHWAGPGENGGWCVLSEWESQDAFERFRRDRLMPAAQQQGGPGTIQPRIFTVYREYHADEQGGRAARAA